MAYEMWHLIPLLDLFFLRQAYSFLLFTILEILSNQYIMFIKKNIFRFIKKRGTEVYSPKDSMIESKKTFSLNQKHRNLKPKLIILY